MPQTNTVGKHCTEVIKTQNMLIVQYHNTRVVKSYYGTGKNYTILNSGGWETPTTKLRMNQASNQYGLDYNVWQKNREWYVSVFGNTYAFSNKMMINYDTKKVLRLDGAEILPIEKK
jgi:hypothetical protein